MEEKAPERLFACFCRRNPANTEVSVKVYSDNATLPLKVDPVRSEHLRYTYNLGERGITWAAGPLGGFQGTLSIYAVNAEEEARKAKQNDPYYLNGMFCDDRYYEWFIHAPLDLASPAHKSMLEESLRKAGMEHLIGRKISLKHPERLFACFSKMTPILKGSGEIVKEHFRYQFGYLWQEGLTWAGGPLGSYNASLQILAVNSLDEAKRAVENDPFSVQGIFYDNEFYEWFIHAPFGKASPAHKEQLRLSLIKTGIMPDAML